MTDKTMYLMGVRLLTELDYESSRLSDEEQAAIEKTKDVLARFYAQECLADIDFGMNPYDDSCHLEGFIPLPHHHEHELQHEREYRA